MKKVNRVVFGLVKGAPESLRDAEYLVGFIADDVDHIKTKSIALDALIEDLTPMARRFHCTVSELIRHYREPSVVEWGVL